MDLEQKAIERIKTASTMSLHHYGQPLVCAYSGGKDSDVMLELFKRSGISFNVHNSHTTVDTPSTIYHIREKFYALELQGIKCSIQKPMYKGKPTTMWAIISDIGIPPTRIARYCCKILKETGCPNRFIATGVRWDESNARSERATYETISKTKKAAIKISDEIMLMNDNSDKRKMTEHCIKNNKMVVNPIIDWSHRDIWDYIHAEGIAVNILYEWGYKRVGCIGCPMAGKNRWKEFADFPTYQRAYIRAFDKMLKKLKQSPYNWSNGRDVFLWWMEDQNIKGQMNLFDDNFIEI